MDALLLILVLGALGIAIAYWAIREDQQNKEIEKLVNNAIDRDKDGVILEGTPFERKTKVATAKPKAKAKAKPKTPAKAKPKPKAKPKAKKAPAKKKPVAKKKAK